MSTQPFTMTTSATLYSYEADAVLSGAAMLKAVGWPAGYMPAEAFSETVLRSLAGESFSVPIIAQVSFAIYLCPSAPWWKR